MIKKTIILMLFLLLSSCGYEAIYSKKNSTNYDFFISELNFTGDRDVNLKIKEKLNNYTRIEKGKNFILNVSSSVNKTILAKDAAGKATSLKSTIIIDIEVLMKKGFETNLLITESFDYKNIVNKFDLERYEREIINNLTETATDKLIFKLSNI